MSDDFLNEFESTENGAIWEPKQTGSKKNKDLKPLEATNKSFLAGWFLGSKEGLGEKKNSTLHKFKVERIGDESHVQGDLTNDKISLWGTGVLDSKIVDEGIQIGQFIVVVWKGKSTPKNGGNDYHNWEIRVPKDLSKYPPLPLSEIGGVTTTSSPQSEATDAPGDPEPVPVTDLNEADDDELPF